MWTTLIAHAINYNSRKVTSKTRCSDRANSWDVLFDDTHI